MISLDPVPVELCQEHLQRGPSIEQSFHLLPTLVKELHTFRPDHSPRLYRMDNFFLPVYARTHLFDQGKESPERLGACSAPAHVGPKRTQQHNVPNAGYGTQPILTRRTGLRFRDVNFMVCAACLDTISDVTVFYRSCCSQVPVLCRSRETTIVYPRYGLTE